MRLIKIKKQKGSILLETLISVAIFVTGVVGIMHLNGVMVKQTSEAKYRADASFFAQEVAGKMWADISHVSSYTDATYAPRLEVENKIKTALPNGTLSVITTTGGTSTEATITVSWRQAGEPQRKVVANATIAN